MMIKDGNEIFAVEGAPLALVLDVPASRRVVRTIARPNAPGDARLALHAAPLVPAQVVPLTAADREALQLSAVDAWLRANPADDFIAALTACAAFNPQLFGETR